MIEPYRSHDSTLREKLSNVIETLPTENITLSAFLEIMGNDGVVLIVIILALPFMVPFSIPGISIAFGAIILLVGLSIIFDRYLWLPKRLMNKRLDAGSLREALRISTRWLIWLEKISHQRLLWMTRGRMGRLNGLMIMIGGLLLMTPFAIVPLTNTLPGISLLFISIGILQKDGYAVIIGYLFNVVTIAYFVVLVGVSAIATHVGVERIMPIFM